MAGKIGAAMAKAVGLSASWREEVNILKNRIYPAKQLHTGSRCRGNSLGSKIEEVVAGKKWSCNGWEAVELSESWRAEAKMMKNRKKSKKQLRTG